MNIIFDVVEQVDLLLSFCSGLGLSSVVLVGHDDGGIIVLKAAEKARRFRSFSVSDFKMHRISVEQEKMKNYLLITLILVSCAPFGVSHSYLAAVFFFYHVQKEKFNQLFSFFFHRLYTFSLPLYCLNFRHHSWLL